MGPLWRGASAVWRELAEYRLRRGRGPEHTDPQVTRPPSMGNVPLNCDCGGWQAGSSAGSKGQTRPAGPEVRAGPDVAAVMAHHRPTPAPVSWAAAFLHATAIFAELDRIRSLALSDVKYENYPASNGMGDL